MMNAKNIIQHDNVHYITKNYVLRPIYNDENECINDMLSRLLPSRGTFVCENFLERFKASTSQQFLLLFFTFSLSLLASPHDGNFFPRNMRHEENSFFLPSLKISFSHIILFLRFFCTPLFLSSCAPKSLLISIFLPLHSSTNLM